MTSAVLRRTAAAHLPARDALSEVQASHRVALALEGIDLSFGGIQALRNISFDLRQAEIRAVIGPNGAGKSSLVNVISGLYRADRGRIVIGEQSFSHLTPQALPGLGIARSFQNLALFPGLTVAQNIAAGLVFRRKAGALAHLLALPQARAETRKTGTRVAEIAEFLELQQHLHRPVSTLAYGLQKQVELARALVAKPKVLLLDEPMAGLTGAEKAVMAERIARVRADLGLAVILIEHDISVVMGLSDRIAVLDRGVKIADATPAEIARDPLVISAYLGEPEDIAADLPAPAALRTEAA